MWCRAHYLDASALVKLVAEDPDEKPGRETLRGYYRTHAANVYATSFSVAETFSAFKSKLLRKRINEDQYIEYIRSFIRTVLGANLRIDEVTILSPLVSRADQLIKTHQIDFLDCLQILTILEGRFRHNGPNSKSLLITADNGLASAARAEGAAVWLCTNEPAPED